MRSLAAATVIVAMWVSPTFATQLSSMFASHSHDFGTVARAAKTEHRFYFDNPFNQTLHVQSVRTSCGCTTPLVETHEVPAKGRGSILAKFNTGTHTGQRAATLTVTFTKPVYGEVQLHVKGYIRTDVVFNPGEASFGTVDQGQSKSIDVALEYAGRPDWQIKGINASEGFLTATATEVSRASGRVRYNLSIQLSENAPTGPLQSEITVLTNDRNLTRVPLRVVANVAAGLSASPSSIALGDVLPDESMKQLVILKGNKEFLVKSISSDVFDIESSLGDEPKSMQPLQLVLKPKSADFGREIKGTIRFETDLADKPEIEVVAVYRLKAPAAEESVGK